MPETLPLQDATPLLQNPTALRARTESDGFLYFKNFLPKEPLLQLPRQILEICNHHACLRKNAPIMEAVADLPAIAQSDAKDKTLSFIGVTRDAYRDIQSLELFHTLPHHPNLIALYEKIFAAE